MKLLLTSGLSLFAAPFKLTTSSPELTRQDASDELFIPVTQPKMSAQVLLPKPTLIIDASFISQYVAAKSIKQRDDMVQFIMRMRRFDKAFEQSFDLVFSRLPHFTIQLTPSRVISHDHSLKTHKKEKGDAVFFPIQALYFPEEELYKNTAYGQILLTHEMRHAAMNAIQVTLAHVPYTLSADCFFPPQDPQEKNRLIAMFNKGKARIDQLKSAILLERQGKLNGKERESLQHWREQLNKGDLFNRYYNKPHVIVDPLVIKNMGGSLKTGDVFIGNYHEQHVITKITRSHGDIKAIHYHGKDPLYSHALHLSFLERFINHVYDADKKWLEFDAFMHSEIPQCLIQFFYKELYHYSQSLFNKAMNTPLNYRTSQATFYTKYDTDKIYVLNPQLSPESSSYFQNVKTLVDHGDFVNAKKGLTRWLKSGNEKAETYLWLAKISALQGNAKEESYYCRRAQKAKLEQKTAPSIEKAIHICHASTLEKVGLYKIPKKPRALTTSDSIEPDQSEHYLKVEL